jgi:hypothetical protein
VGTEINNGHCANCGEQTFPTDNGWAYEKYCSKTCRMQYEEPLHARPYMPDTYAKEAAKVRSPVDPFVLPTDAEERKEIPIFSGVLNYFPLAIAAVARVSKAGNDKHNPGQPLHWARGKSMDHPDCIARHLIDIETVDPATGEYADAAALAWRALAKLQELEERRLGKPYSRGSRG